jgi:hypothetical protein
LRKEAQAALEEGSLTGSGPLIRLDEILLATFLVLGVPEQHLLYFRLQKCETNKEAA